MAFLFLFHLMHYIQRAFIAVYLQLSSVMGKILISYQRLLNSEIYFN